MELSQYFRVPEEKSVPLNLEHIIIWKNCANIIY
jgi:hypothetical protein